MQTLVFDLDGTLTDPARGITQSIRYALLELTGTSPEPEDLTWCIGPPLRDSLHKILGNGEMADRALVLYRERFSDVGLFENTVYPDIPRVLATLQESGRRMYLATSKPNVYAVRILDHFGLLKFFTKVYGSELDGTRSAKSELLCYLLHRQNLVAADTTMIGDRKYDIEGARRNGMRTAGVTYGYGSRQELIQAEPDTLVDAPAGLLGL